MTTMQTDIESKVRARLTERGISGPAAEKVMEKVRARLAERGIDTEMPPEVQPPSGPDPMRMDPVNMPQAAALGVTMGVPGAVAGIARYGQAGSEVASGGYGALTAPGATRTDRGMGALGGGGAMTTSKAPTGFTAPPVEQPTRNVFGRVADTAGAITGTMQGMLPQKVTEPFTAEWFAFTFGQSLPGIAASIAATTGVTFATGNPGAGMAAGAAVMFPLEAGAQAEAIYQDRLKQGFSEDEALVDAFLPATVTGLINAGVEQGGIQQLFATGFLKKGIKRALADWLGATATEGLEEGIQGNVSRGVQLGVTGEGPGLLSGENVATTLEEMAGGAAAGFALGGPAAVGQVFGEKAGAKRGKADKQKAIDAAAKALHGTGATLTVDGKVVVDNGEIVTPDGQRVRPAQPTETADRVERELTEKQRAATAPPAAAPAAPAPAEPTGPTTDTESKVLRDLGIDPADFSRRVEAERDRALIDADPRTLTPEDRERRVRGLEAELQRKAAEIEGRGGPIGEQLARGLKTTPEEMAALDEEIDPNAAFRRRQAEQEAELQRRAAEIEARGGPEGERIARGVVAGPAPTAPDQAGTPRQSPSRGSVVPSADDTAAPIPVAPLATDKHSALITSGMMDRLAAWHAQGGSQLRVTSMDPVIAAHTLQELNPGHMVDARDVQRAFAEYEELQSVATPPSEPPSTPEGVEPPAGPTLKLAGTEAEGKAAPTLRWDDGRFKDEFDAEAEKQDFLAAADVPLDDRPRVWKKVRATLEHLTELTPDELDALGESYRNGRELTIAEPAPTEADIEKAKSAKTGGGMARPPGSRPQDTAPTEPTAREPWEMTREEFAWNRGTTAQAKISSVSPETMSVADDAISRLSPEAFDVWNRAVKAAKSSGAGGVGSAVDARKTTPADRNALAALGLSATTDRMSNPMMAVSQVKRADIARKNVEHKRAIQNALDSGKPVPPEVLADYPDLKAKPQATEEPATEPDGAAAEEKPSITDAMGNKEFWAKTRSELEQEKKDAIRSAKERRADVNKMKPSEGFAKWRVRSMSTTAKDDIEGTTKYHEGLLGVHKERVQEAIDAGNPVPPEVLADYPDLRARAEAVSGGRPKRPDGRLEPRIGDKVYQVVAGFGGMASYIYGEVYDGGKSRGLRVRTTGSAAMIGSAPTGKTYKLDGNWTVKDDPEIERRRKAQIDKDKAREDEFKQQLADGERQTRESYDSAIARGEKPITDDTPPGAIVTLHGAGNQQRMYLEGRTTDEWVTLSETDLREGGRTYPLKEVTDTGGRVDLRALQIESAEKFLAEMSGEELTEMVKSVGGRPANIMPAAPWDLRFADQVRAEAKKRGIGETNPPVPETKGAETETPKPKSGTPGASGETRAGEPTVPKAAQEYAAKFGVVLTVEKHGVYGNDWDWVAKPEKPSWYPSVKRAIAPHGTDPRDVVRMVAEQMGTGKSEFRGFFATDKAPKVPEKEEPPGSAAPHFKAKASVMTPAGSLAAGSVGKSNSPSSVWYYQGTPSDMGMAATVTVAGQAPTKAAKDRYAKAKAAQKAGWSFANYRTSRMGTVWVFEKDGNILTNAGFEAMDAAVSSRPALPPDSPNFFPRMEAYVRAFVDWMRTLPSGIESDAGTVSRALSSSPIASWARTTTSSNTGAYVVEFLNEDGSVDLRLDGRTAQEAFDTVKRVADKGYRAGLQQQPSAPSEPTTRREGTPVSSVAGPDADKAQTPRDVVVADLDTRLGQSAGFKKWLRDLADDEAEYQSFISDDSARRDYLEDYLKDEHQIRVLDDGVLEFEELTPEAQKIIGNNRVLVYHHTSDAVLPKIRTRGLVAGLANVNRTMGEDAAGVYVTTEGGEYSPAVRGYLDRARQQLGGNPITLEVVTTTDALQPDPDDQDIASGRKQFVLPSVAIDQIRMDGKPLATPAAPAPPTEVDATGPYTFDFHKQFFTRVRQGNATAEEYKAQFRRMLDSEASIKGGLMARTMKDLAPKGAGGMTKRQIVDQIWSRLVGRYVLEDSFGYSPMTETYEHAVSNWVAKVTDKDITDYSARLAEKRAANEKALSNPETLAEFNQFIDVKGKAALTPEQLAKYDEIIAGHERKGLENRKKNESVAHAVKADTTITVKEGFHDKKQIPIWIASLGDRVDSDTFNALRDRAKKMGGWWSSFKKDATGFIFENEQAAKDFADTSKSVRQDERVEETAEEAKLRAAQRLIEQGENAQERAQESLSQDRQTNTARRAAMASGAEASARSEEAIGKTLAAIGRSIVDGTAKFLASVNTRAQVEAIDGVINEAKNEWYQALDPDAKREFNRKYEHRWSRAPVTPEVIAKAKMPWPHIFGSDIRELAKDARTRSGLKRDAKRLDDMVGRLTEADNDLYIVKSEAERELLQSVAFRLRINKSEWTAAGRTLERLARFNRIWKMGVRSDESVRAMLREYIALKEEAKAPDKLVEMERALAGMGKGIGIDFFPTPPALAQQVIAEAGIEPGMTVLEPSAGKGDLADAAKAAGATVETAEISSTLRPILEEKGYKLVGNDFLDMPVEEKYDRVVMNPPFSGNADIDHVRHGFAMLKPGGRLVAIMSNHALFASGKKETEFREWVEANGGLIEQLPEGSFAGADAFRKTGVNAILLTLDKGEAAAETAAEPDVKGSAREAAKYEIYSVSVSGRPDLKYAVRESEHANGFGDTLFDSLVAASEYAASTKTRDAANAESRNKRAAEDADKQAKKDVETAAREDTDGFADSMDALRRGKAIAALNKLVSIDGVPGTVKEHVKRMVAAGAELVAKEEPAVKPMTRTEFNRAGQREQDAHEKRMKEAGNKTVYRIDGYELGKIAYDYAAYLKGRETPAQAPETKAGASDLSSLIQDRLALEAAARKAGYKGISTYSTKEETQAAKREERRLRAEADKTAPALVGAVEASVGKYPGKVVAVARTEPDIESPEGKRTLDAIELVERDMEALWAEERKLKSELGNKSRGTKVYDALQKKIDALREKTQQRHEVYQKGINRRFQMLLEQAFNGPDFWRQLGAMVKLDQGHYREVSEYLNRVAAHLISVMAPQVEADVVKQVAAEAVMDFMQSPLSDSLTEKVETKLYVHKKKADQGAAIARIEAAAPLQSNERQRARKEIEYLDDPAKMAEVVAVYEKMAAERNKQEEEVARITAEAEATKKAENTAKLTNPALMRTPSAKQAMGDRGMPDGDEIQANATQFFLVKNIPAKMRDSILKLPREVLRWPRNRQEIPLDTVRKIVYDTIAKSTSPVTVLGALNTEDGPRVLVLHQDLTVEAFDGVKFAFMSQAAPNGEWKSEGVGKPAALFDNGKPVGVIMPTSLKVPLDIEKAVKFARSHWKSTEAVAPPPTHRPQVEKSLSITEGAFPTLESLGISPQLDQKDAALAKAEAELYAATGEPARLTEQLQATKEFQDRVDKHALNLAGAGNEKNAHHWIPMAVAGLIRDDPKIKEAERITKKLREAEAVARQERNNEMSQMRSAWTPEVAEKYHDAIKDFVWWRLDREFQALENKWREDPRLPILKDLIDAKTQPREGFERLPPGYKAKEGGKPNLDSGLPNYAKEVPGSTFGVAPGSIEARNRKRGPATHVVVIEDPDSDPNDTTKGLSSTGDIKGFIERTGKMLRTIPEFAADPVMTADASASMLEWSAGTMSFSLNNPWWTSVAQPGPVKPGETIRIDPEIKPQGLWRVGLKPDTTVAVDTPAGSKAAKILTKLDELEAKFRENLKKNVIPRGRTTGGAINPITEISNLAGIAAVRAARQGIRKGQQFTKIVNDAIKEIAPHLSAYADRVRSIARAIVEDSWDAKKDAVDWDKFDRAVGRMQERIAKGPAPRIKKVIAEKTGLAATRENEDSALKDELAATEKATTAIYRMGEKDALMAALPVWKAEVQQARKEERDAARRRAQTENIESRGDIDALKARLTERADEKIAALRGKAEDQAATAKAREASAQAVREKIVSEIKDKLSDSRDRARFLNAVAKSKTLRQLYRTLERIERSMWRRQARNAQSVIVKLNRWKHAKRLDPAERRRVRAIKTEAAGLIETAFTTGVPLADLARASSTLRELANEAIGIWTEAKMRRAENVAAMRQQKETTAAKIAANVMKITPHAKGPRDPMRIKEPRTKLRTRLWRGLSDAFNTAESVEGVNAGDLRRVMYDDVIDGETKTHAQDRDNLAESDRIVRAAGFKDLNDFIGRSTTFYGDGRTEYMEVTIGGKQRKIDLGTAFHIASTDQSTLKLIAEGLSSSFEDAKNLDKIQMDLEEIQAIADEYNRRFPGLVAGAKAQMRAGATPAFAVAYDLNGWYPEVLDDYWPRFRNREKAEGAALPQAAREFSRRYLETLGLLERRVEDAETPLLIKNGAIVWIEHMQQLSKLQHMARPVRNAAAILEDPTLKQAVTRIWGAKMLRILRGHLLESSLANESGGSKGWGVRTVRWLNRNIAVANLAWNFISMLKNYGGSARLGAMMGADFASGVAGAGKITLEGLSKKSGYFWHRYHHGGFHRFSAVLEEATLSEGATLRDAIQTIAANIKARDVGGVDAGWSQFGQVAMRAYNAVDGHQARIAYAGALAKAKRENPGASLRALETLAVEQAELWMRGTQNPSSPSDMALWSAQARHSALSAFFLFMSDTFKGQNFLRASRSKKDAGVRAVAEGVNQGWAAAVTFAAMPLLYMIGAAIWGDDDDKKKEHIERLLRGDRAAAIATRQVISVLLPIPGLPNAVDYLTGNRYDAHILDTPITAAVEDMGAAVVKASNAATDEDLWPEERWEKIGSAATRFGDATSSLIGDPSLGLRRTIRPLLP